MWMKLQFPCLAAVKKEFSSHFHCFLTFLCAFYDRIIKWFFSFPLLLCSQLKSAAESRLSQVKRFCNLQLESHQSDADKEHELRVRWHEWALRNIENREIKKKIQIRLHRKLNCIPQCNFSSTSTQSFAFAIWACATSNERKIKIQHSRNHIAATEREREQVEISTVASSHILSAACHDIMLGESLRRRWIWGFSNLRCQCRELETSRIFISFHASRQETLSSSQKSFHCFLKNDDDNGEEKRKLFWRMWECSWANAPT